MGLWDNCVAAAEVLAHPLAQGYARDSASDTDGYFAFVRTSQNIFLKRPNAFAKIALIYVEEVYEDADLEQPDWELVSCEY